MSDSTDRRLSVIVAGDPAQRTGGYLYDAQIVAQLRRAGWTVDVIGLAGRFPDADHHARDAMQAALSAMADDSLVIIDGLALGGLPEIVTPHAARLRLLTLVHHPLADERGLDATRAERFERLERAALRAMRGVITTSRFTAQRVANMGVQSSRIKVVEPGVDAQALAPADHACPQLLCVATLTPRKGHDVLVEALARVADLDWRCRFIGSDSRDPQHAAHIRALVRQHGLDKRIELRGECSDEALRAAYLDTDLFMLPSHYEGYGMVISEALAAGLPVLTTTGGALADTLPPGAGLTVPPGDTEALATSLRRLLNDPAERLRLRDGARKARLHLGSWAQAGERFARVLEALSTSALADANAPPHPDTVFDADWLSLRQAADHAARDTALTATAAAWLTQRQTESQRPLRILDLGSGSGSNPRYLAPRLPGPQHWTLLDQDASLLARAVDGCQSLRDCHGRPVSAESRQADLHTLDTTAFAEYALVTASALIDLVDTAWLETFADACVHAGCAVLVALSVDGQWTLHAPSQAGSAAGSAGNIKDDDFVRAAFNAHQQRDKGVGGALGPDAAHHLAAVLRARGFAVTLAPSPWRLSAAKPAHAALIRALMDGWCRAAIEQCPEACERIDRWHRRRQSDLDQGTLEVEVGHLDLLALPRTSACIGR